MAGGWVERIDWHEVHTALSRLAHKERTAYVDLVAARVGRSRASIYRELRKRFGKAKSSPRARTKCTPALLHEVMRLKAVSSIIRPDGRDLSTHECLAIMQENGFVGAGSVSVNAVNGALAEAGFRQRKTYTRVLANHACETYQFDFSRLKFFQLHKPDPDNPGDWLLRVSARELHYKKNGRRLRTWIVQLKDEHSALRVARAYPASGESYVLGLTFLRWALSREPDDHPMNRYLMERLKCDNGSFRKNAEVKSIAAALGFELPASTPGHKESQGKVESGFASIWQTFEQPLAVRLIERHGSGCLIRLSEYNALLHEHLIQEQHKAHPYYRLQTRGELFRQSVLRVRPRTLDVDLATVSFSVHERVVQWDGSVVVDNLHLAVPGLGQGERVRVLVNRKGRFVCEPLRDNADPFEIFPATGTMQGDFSGRSTHIRDQVEKTVLADLTAKGRKRTVVPLMPNTEPAPVASPFVEPDEAPAPAMMSYLKTMAYIGRGLNEAGLSRAVVRGLNAELTDLTGSGLTRDAADDVVSSILALSRKAM